MSREFIAKTLKRLREKSGLTADQVGEMVGKSGKTVNAWENNRGQPDAETLMELCDIYGVSDILLEFRENAKTAPTEQVSESDFQKQRLLHNYDSLNQTGKDKLVEYSDDLKVNPKYNVADEEKTVRIRAIARNGTITESEVTQKDVDEALAMIKASETDCDL